MYIKLNGADASAKNLGHLDIQELDQTTISIMNNWTRFLVHSQEAYLLDEFITTLKTNGIWSKVHLLWLPWMAASVSELYYNPQGVVLNEQKEDNTSVLFAENSIIKFSGSVGSNNKSMMMAMPAYDIRGKFMALGNTGYATGRYTFISSASGQTPFNIVQNNIAANTTVSPIFNWNTGIGSSRSTKRAATYIIASDYVKPDSDNLSKVRVTNNSGVFVDASVIGTLPAPINGVTEMEAICVGSYGSGTISPAKSITDVSYASYVLGNTTLSEADGLILDAALEKFMKGIYDLHH